MRTETPSFSVQEEKAIGETAGTPRSEVSIASTDEFLRLQELEAKHLSDEKARLRFALEKGTNEKVFEIAKKLLDTKLSKSEITEATGLSLDVVHRLRD